MSDSMNEKALVSVVVASYNMGSYLPLAVSSALAQTYDRIEVLIIDDGSTDNTAAIAQGLLTDPRVRYIHQQNGGQASSKNRGIRESKGEFIAFLDADDLWEPTKLEEQLPLFEKSAKVGVVCARYVEIDAEGKELRVDSSTFFRGKVSGRLLKYNYIGFSTSVVRRECFETLGCFKENLGMGIDYDLWLRFSTRYEFDFVDRTLVRYRVWSGQMSKNLKRRYLNGIAIMQQFLQEYPGVVSEHLRREAWAHTFSGFGDCLRATESSMNPALQQYLRALSHRPDYVHAWKGLLKVAIGKKN